ncbi:CPCC family cysteine-rich protein [Thalassotalea loyana]|uniref:CPCC family cysteine-rich protein n=1 Tax=Thalassotalea loyana TaxID=280483 RepID=UPI0024E0DC0B|nr:CPCC family cysteine-rich protein [Thalassotalea loyana]
MRLNEFPKSDEMKQCPCCDYFALAERGYSLVCPVCFWEDDCEDYSLPNLDQKSDVNNDLTLREARENFLKYGACAQRFAEVVVDSEERDSLKYELRSI